MAIFTIRGKGGGVRDDEKLACIYIPRALTSLIVWDIQSSEVSSKTCKCHVLLTLTAILFRNTINPVLKTKIGKWKFIIWKEKTKNEYEIPPHSPSYNSGQGIFSNDVTQTKY